MHSKIPAALVVKRSIFSVVTSSFNYLRAFGVKTVICSSVSRTAETLNWFCLYGFKRQIIYIDCASQAAAAMFFFIVLDCSN